MAGIYSNYLFKVRNIKSNKIYNVYGTIEKDNVIYFLFYAGGKWRWERADLFQPTEFG